MDNNQIDINLSSDIKTDRAQPLNITLMSRDINNNQFRISLTSNGEKVQLNDSFTVEVLSVFQKTKAKILTTAEVYGYQALWSFDTKFITGTDTVFNYVYLKKDGVPIVSADANAFYFNVGLSKIDENAGRIAESYDQNYEKVLHEFEVAINLTKDEWAQMADEARNFVDEIKDTAVDQFVELKMGEELANLEANYAVKLAELQTNDNTITAQLAQKPNADEVRKITTPIGLNDVDGDLLGAISGGDGTPISVESIPRIKSVGVDKLTPHLKNEILFYNNQLESFKENANVWTGDRANVSSDENFLKIVGRNTSGGFARGIAKVQPPYKDGDRIFVRLGVKITNNQGSPTSQVRVLLRNGLSGTIHAQPAFDANIDQFQYIHFTTNLVNPTDLTLMVDYRDTVDADMVGKELTVSYTYVGNLTNLFGENTPPEEDVATMLGNNESIYNPEKIFKKMVEIEQKSQVINIDTTSLVNQSILQINKNPSGDVSYEVLDYLKYPLTKSWGNEYLYAWYKKLVEDVPVKLVFGGDSTTANTSITNSAYHRNNLAKKMLIRGGYDESKITSLNHGHGGHHTGDWIGTHLAVDMAENPDLYVLGYGINDGGTNYFPGTTIQERADGFEQRLREGLSRIRTNGTYPSGPSYGKSADVLPIIITMPITTNNELYGRTKEKWHNFIRPIIQKACRDYQCAFVDLAMHHYDRTYTTAWSTGGDNVHPNHISTADYMSAFKDLLLPYAFEK